MKEESTDALDFGSLTNSEIETRIIMNHKKLMSYFNKLDIKREVKADSYASVKNLKPEFIEKYNFKFKQIIKLYNATPLDSLVDSARIYYDKLSQLIKSENLGTEIIVLGTSFANHCFYTDHLFNGQKNTQVDIGNLSFNLSWESDYNIPFENLPHLAILEGDVWYEEIEDYEDIPFIDNLTELHHNALRMMFHKAFVIAFQNLNTKAIALSLEYYDKEDLDFIHI